MGVILKAHISVHQTRQDHKVHTNDLDKWPNNVVLPIVLDQRAWKIKVHTLKILKPICYMLYEGINWSLPKALSPQQVVLELGF